MRLRRLLTVSFSTLCIALAAQNDSINLHPERLAEPDILPLKESERKTLVLSATRTATDANEQPFPVFIITSDEILRNGWITLCDVLKNAPGLRVSQPGNAFDGETFLMRGLSGNSFAKILINDVPIKPSAAGGMPIGAQLPIRQAERIEILYGPAATIYGADASAGVINIILKETERPLFTQADLRSGASGYSSLDLFFGGKFGRDKNIFRFAVFGSGTVMNDRDLYHDSEKTTLFEGKNYLLDWQDTTFLTRADNFLAEPNGSSPTLALTNKTPHESRLVGLNLTWRGLHFSYNQLFRRDHSSIGLSPLAVGYGNSQNYVGERIETFSLGFERQKPRRDFFFNFSTVNYRLDDRSSFSWVQPMAANYFLQQVDSTLSFSPDSLRFWQNYLQRSMLGRSRYSFASSIDFRQEIRFARRWRHGWQFDLGVTASLSLQRAVVHFSEVPAQGQFFDNNFRFFSITNDDNAPAYAGNLHSFAQLQWKNSRFHLVAGLGSVSFPQTFTTPRVALAYKPKPWLVLRGSYSTGVQQPSAFQQGNSYWIGREDGLSMNRLFRAFNKSDDFSAARFLETTEQTEFGLRAFSNKFYTFDYSFFWLKTSHFAADGFRKQPDLVLFGDSVAREYGWLNDENSAIWSSGRQWWLRMNASSFNLKLTDKMKPIRVHWSNQFSGAVLAGKTRLPQSTTIIKGIAGQPSRIFMYETRFFTSKTDITFRVNRIRSAPHGFLFWENRWKRAVSQTETSSPTFATCDLMVRFSLSKNFQVYCTTTNLFGRIHAGLDATNSPDDLIYNPQPGRQVRLGINYNMN